MRVVRKLMLQRALLQKQAAAYIEQANALNAEFRAIDEAINLRLNALGNIEPEVVSLVSGRSAVVGQASGGHGMARFGLRSNQSCCKHWQMPANPW